MSCFVDRMQRKQQRKKQLLAQKEQSAAVFNCTGCGSALFDGDTKFDSGTGFPSFWSHVEDHVKQNPLSTYGRERIQLLCAHCGQHLGHLFPNKHTPTKLRYCINADAINCGSLA